MNDILEIPISFVSIVFLNLSNSFSFYRFRPFYFLHIYIFRWTIQSFPEIPHSFLALPLFTQQIVYFFVFLTIPIKSVARGWFWCHWINDESIDSRWFQSHKFNGSCSTRVGIFESQFNIPKNVYRKHNHTYATKTAQFPNTFNQIKRFERSRVQRRSIVINLFFCVRVNLCLYVYHKSTVSAIFFDFFVHNIKSFFATRTNDNNLLLCFPIIGFVFFYE